MAEAFARKYGADASSAGTLPSTSVNPIVIAAMKEKGIDLSKARPKLLTRRMIEEADLVVTMGCTVEEVCPAPLIAKMEKKLEDWKLEGPKGEPIEKVREIRDEIERKVSGLTTTQANNGRRYSTTTKLALAFFIVLGLVSLTLLVPLVLHLALPNYELDVSLAIGILFVLSTLIVLSREHSRK